MRWLPRWAQSLLRRSQFEKEMDDNFAFISIADPRKHPRRAGYPTKPAAVRC